MGGAIYNIVMAALGVILFLFIFIKVFNVNGNRIQMILINIISGFGFLLIANMFTVIFGFRLGINPFTVLVSTISGIPGVLALVIIFCIT